MSLDVFILTHTHMSMSTQNTELALTLCKIPFTFYFLFLEFGSERIDPMKRDFLIFLSFILEINGFQKYESNYCRILFITLKRDHKDCCMQCQPQQFLFQREFKIHVVVNLRTYKSTVHGYSVIKFTVHRQQSSI